MKRINHIALAAILALGISSSVMAGDISGGRAIAGDISGGRAIAGDISGGRAIAGDISGGKAIAGDISAGLVDLFLIMFSVG
jgi:hypothetical protein